MSNDYINHCKQRNMEDDNTMSTSKHLEGQTSQYSLCMTSWWNIKAISKGLAEGGVYKPKQEQISLLHKISIKHKSDKATNMKISKYPKCRLSKTKPYTIQMWERWKQNIREHGCSRWKEYLKHKVSKHWDFGIRTNRIIPAHAHTIATATKSNRIVTVFNAAFVNTEWESLSKKKKL